ncbi:MAG: V-type ATP synthase subunit E [Oscillospiraceae bacterium]|nr:V-type ATP synthase subunit E [Oscillospiraceae bacterium]
MSTENEKLQKFISAVNEEIDAKVSRLLEEAEAEKESIISAAKAESESVSAKYAASEQKKNGSRYVKDISKAELEMKKDVLRRREELCDKVFDAVEKRLSDYRKTNAYADGLVKALLLMNVGSGSEIRLAPEDMKLAEVLKRIVKAEDVTFAADSSIKLGGFSVYSKEKHTIVDKTFDIAVEEQRSAFINSNAFAN